MQENQLQAFLNELINDAPDGMIYLELTASDGNATPVVQEAKGQAQQEPADLDNSTGTGPNSQEETCEFLSRLKVVYCNNTAIRLLRLEKGETSSWRNSNGFVPEDNRPGLLGILPQNACQSIMAEVRKALVTGTTQTWTIHLGFAEDTGVTVLCEAKPMQTGMALRLLDITGRSKLESALTEAKGVAEASAAEKADVLAVMSHEIRNPLNGVLGMMQLLLETDLSNRQRDILENMRYSGEAVMTLLSDILDFSQLEAERMELDKTVFQPWRLITEAVNLLRSRAEGKSLYLNLQIDPDLPSFLSGDPTRITQLILNLVSNAIKYTETGGVTITVMGNVALEGEDTCWLTIAVQDTGIGMSLEDQQELFKEYHRARTVSRRFGGTGLGLAISKRIVDLMEGRIGVESRPGEGSRFWFAVPLQIATAQMPEKEQKAPKPQIALPPLRALIVEDNAINQKVLQGFVKAPPHFVKVAGNGFEAIEIAQKTEFDVILMDIQMPGIDGVETARRIRRISEHAAHTPIIALTAHALKNDAQDYMAKGFDGYLPKPITRQTLYREIARVLKLEYTEEQGEVDSEPSANQSGDTSVSESLVDIPTLKLIDEEMGREWLHKTLDILRTQGQERIDAIHNGMDKMEFKPAAHQAHSLAGASAQFGMLALERLLKRLEDACLKHDLNQARIRAAVLQTLWDKSIAAVNRFEDKLKQGNEGNA